MGDLKYIKF